jgi:hypothetical protein
LTAGEIRALQPGDSIIGAFGEWDDELPIVEVNRRGGETILLVQMTATTAVRYRPEPNGPELRGARI